MVYNLAIVTGYLLTRCIRNIHICFRHTCTILLSTPLIYGVIHSVKFLHTISLGFFRPATIRYVNFCKLGRILNYCFYRITVIDDRSKISVYSFMNCSARDSASLNSNEFILTARLSRRSLPNGGF